MTPTDPVEAPERGLAICAPFRNEARFLAEWIDFHRSLGVEHFYLYDNLSNDDFAAVLASYLETGVVEVTGWPHDARAEEQWVPQHCRIIEDAMARARGRYRWLAVVDTDEFLVPVGDESLAAVLADYEDYGGLVACSVTYGTDGVERVPDGGLLRTLTRRAPLDYPGNLYVKTIAQPLRVASCPTSHTFTYRDDYFAVDTSGRRVDGIQAPSLCIDRLRLHHYWSRDETFFFGSKVARRVGWGQPYEELVAKREALNSVDDPFVVDVLDRRDGLPLASSESRPTRPSAGDRVRLFIAGGVEFHAAGLREEIRALGERLPPIEASLERITELLGAQRDEIPRLREMLAAARSTPEYAAAWSEREPLITVRIPTWNRAEQLVDGAISSVLLQTYQRFEIIVVGDGCTDDTELRLAKLGDRRVQFLNLPVRTAYPQEQKRRWMVAGSTCSNVATRMAQGTWIAPLDDDDEFTNDHLEVLLDLALEGRHEFVYGRVEREWADSRVVEMVGDYPPALGDVTLQGSMLLRLLNFFEFDTYSWLVDEPGDWNLVRRMVEAGVAMGFTEHVVARMHTTPKFDHGPRAS